LNFDFSHVSPHLDSRDIGDRSIEIKQSKKIRFYFYFIEFEYRLSNLDQTITDIRKKKKVKKKLGPQQIM